jgi:peptide/nickel transport system substrate-binding protein
MDVKKLHGSTRSGCRSAVRRVLRTVCLAIAIGAVAGVLAACGGSGSSSTEASGPPRRGGTLTIATPLEPVSLDPHVSATDAGSQHVQTLIFSRLLEVQPGSLNLVPGLAESWGLGADRRSAVFHLRSAEFSDGSPVSAEDVKFSFERAMQVKTDPFFAESLTKMIQSMSTPNAHTFVLHFSGPRPEIFYYVAMAPLSVISKHVFERLGAKRFAVEPIGAGSGPFEFVKWNKGQSLELARNPHYWRTGLPYLNRVSLVKVPDDNTRLLDVRSGQVDVADEIPYSQLGSIGAAPGVKLHLAPIPAIDMASFDLTGPLRPQAVRQALNYATPKEVIKKIVFADRGAIANSLIPPLHFWDPNVKPYPYDLAKAKQLLDQSGYSHGFAIPIAIPSGDEVSRQIATILQNTWAKIGVRLKVEALDETSLASRFEENRPEVVLIQPTAFSSDIPSEDEFAINYVHLGHEKSGLFILRDATLERLLGQIEGTWNEGERRTLFGQFQQEQMNNPVGIPMIVAEARTALRDNVEGFGYVAMNWFYLDRTWLKR